MFLQGATVSVPVPSVSTFSIVPMVTDGFTDKLGSEPIMSVSVKLTVTVTGTRMETVCVKGP